MEHFCSDDDDDDEKEEGVPEWYWLCLEEQKRMREQIIKQKERRRLLQARKMKSEFPTTVQVPSVPQFSSHLLKYPKPEIHTCTSLFHSDSHDWIVLTGSGPVPRLQVRVNFLTHEEDDIPRHSGTMWTRELSGHVKNHGKRKRAMMMKVIIHVTLTPHTLSSFKHFRVRNRAKSKLWGHLVLFHTAHNETHFFQKGAGLKTIFHNVVSKPSITLR